MPNEERRPNPPRRRGGRGIPEKPKNFAEAITKLVKSLSPFKFLIILSLILAAISSILSLVAPNRLSDLTDEISKGLTINTANAEKLEEDLLSSFNEEQMPKTVADILSLSLDQNTFYKVNTSDISSDDKTTFNNTVAEIQNNPDDTIKLLGGLPDSVLNIILNDSTYDDITILKEEKIIFIKSIASFDIESKDFQFIKDIPTSIAKILLPTSTISDIEITTEDKVAFVESMSNISEDVDVSELYKKVEALPDSIQSLLSPSMNMKNITKIVIFLSILYIASALFNYIEGFSMVKVANNYAKKLRTSISKKINKLPLKFFDHNLAGDILSRVTNDVDTIAQSLNQSLASLVSAITLFIGSIIMMFYTNWIMALTAIVSSLAGFVFMSLILSHSQKYFIARQVELGKLNGYIEEAYSGLNVIKTCNGQTETNEHFDTLNQKLYECSRKSHFLSGLMQPIMVFVGNFGYVAVCIVGALLTSKEIISFGVIVAFITYVRLFTNPLSQIAQSLTSLQTTAAASERVFEFLSEEEMTKEKDTAKKLNKNKVRGKIEFQNVKFGYDEDKIIIKDFTAVAKPGQKIAIIGPTGAGKTTMVNLLMKFYEINSGDIKIDGVSTRELTRENIHSLFTMVLQDTWLFNGTIKENIAYNRKNVSDKRIKEVCETVGIDHFIRTLPNGYDSVLSDNDSVSAGQRQLLTIARGMIEDAPFLILDEATSNVDTRTEELVQKAMDKLMENKTSFIIAHRLSTIRNADLILVMNEGNIVETGTHDSLMKKNGFYANLYNSQFESIK